MGQREKEVTLKNPGPGAVFLDCKRFDTRETRNKAESLQKLHRKSFFAGLAQMPPAGDWAGFKRRDTNTPAQSDLEHFGRAGGN